MIKTTLISLALTLIASVSHAVSVAPYPVAPESVSGFRGGGVTSCAIARSSRSRDDLCNALGQRDVGSDFRTGGFLSVGRYDYVEFTFAQPVRGPVTIWEITGNTNPNYLETMVFELLNTGTGASAIGVARNQDGVPVGRHSFEVVVAEGVTGAFDVLRVIDTSSTPDGFDIDAVSASSVPIPGSASLLFLAILAMGALRRRRL